MYIWGGGFFMNKEGEILYSNFKAIPMQVMMGGLQGVVFAQNALCSAIEGKYQVALCQ